MVIKFIAKIIVITFIVSSFNIAFAQEKAQSDGVIDKNNQMMSVFVERLRSGNVEEARKIAKDMAAFSSKYKDDNTTEYKNFYSNIEKELYLLKNKDNKKKVVWVEEPIADGYYFLAVLDFQDKHYKDAINNIQKCISWNPVHSGYYCERGFIFMNSGIDADIIKAQVAYESALEYANNEEDFASALRGLAFVLAGRGEFEDSAAAMILSKEYDSSRPDADEHLLYLKRLIPSFDFNIDSTKAKKILADSKFQTTYSPEHAKILMKLASELKDKDRAIIFLSRAQMLEPNNTEIRKKLKELQGK